jgi:hypothetical protein
MALLLSLLFSMFLTELCAKQHSDIKPLYRANLHQLRNTEDARLRRIYANNIVEDIYNCVIEEAKAGYTEYIAELKGCGNDDVFRLKPYLCEAIIYDVFTIMPQKFPDSVFVYNNETNMYSISWV